MATVSASKQGAQGGSFPDIWVRIEVIGVELGGTPEIRLVEIKLKS